MKFLLLHFWNMLYVLYFRGMFKGIIYSLCLLLFCTDANSQPIAKQLASKIKAMQSSPQLVHGVVSLCVADATTGKMIYSSNEQLGLMPASNMKVFTAIAALDVLGEDYRFKTEIGYKGNVKDSTLTGDLLIVGYGDPTTGSWRYQQTQPDSIMNRIADVLHRAGIKNIWGDVILDGSKFSFNPVPGGWTWEDLGTYYGAGTWGLNWHENQYDMVLQPSGKIGDSVIVKSLQPPLADMPIVNNLKTAAPGIGDNSYPYLPPYGVVMSLEGTIPAGEMLTASGSMPQPYDAINAALRKMFYEKHFDLTGLIKNSSIDYTEQNRPMPHYDSLIGTVYSPSMDSVIYWFLKKSINLYGEDLVKTMALEKYGLGTTDSGIAILRNYWLDRGIEKSAFQVIDGSGLSAQDHVTTYSLVQALLYAKTRNWFPAFYNALPVYNGMHMKSGTISGVKSFSGYHTSAKGKQYIFSIIVNNYDDASDSILNKMYDVLDELKK